MRKNSIRLGAWILLMSAVLVPSVSSAAGVFTVQFESDPLLETPVVAHSNVWRYRPGLSEPSFEWKTAPDAALDGTWILGAGGFGYGDPGIQGEATSVPEMANLYSTLYLRKEFEVQTTFDSSARLQLTVDYDDGFVAYLDGAELTRANLTNGVGEFVACTSTTGASSHEASCCNAPTNAATVYDLGPASLRLLPGKHVLGFIGVNQVIGSSDFHLIPDLTVITQPSRVLNGELLSVAQTNQVKVFGTNTIAGATRVTVNGADAVFSSADGIWSATAHLAPGFNRLIFQALDSAGKVLVMTNRDIVFKQVETFVGGLVREAAVWDSSLGVVRVTNNVMVTAGGSLNITAGTVVLVDSGLSITATNANVQVAGRSDAPVYFLPSNGSGPWKGLLAAGLRGGLTVRHAEMAAGPVQILDRAAGLIEDTTVRDYLVADPPIFYTENAGSATLRRCHLTRYFETHFVASPTLIEDSLLEYMLSANSDGIDFDTMPPGCAIRRCTLRHGKQTNTDAIDLGTGCDGTIIEDCHLYDFSDKGVSIGEGSAGAMVRNCLIDRVGIGIEIKDGSTASALNNTIADSAQGMRLRIKTGTQGGHLTNAANNIIWGNPESILLLNDSTAVLQYSDIQGTVWPGVGNISADPLFLNSTAADYRLGANSPASAAGLSGLDMGASFPVGAPMAPSNPKIDAVSASNGNLVMLVKTDPEGVYALEASELTLKGAWSAVATVPVGPYPATVQLTFPIQPGTWFYRIAKR